MVVFVADASCKEIISLKDEFISVAIERPYLHMIRPVDLTGLAGNRKTALTANL